MVAAALVGDTLRPKKVWRSEEFDALTKRGLEVPHVDVEFWVGHIGPGTHGPCYICNADAVVWVPADPVPPDKSLAQVLDLDTGGIGDVPAGVTIDPEGYTSDLLGAFEAGTSGDLGAPVFRRRVELKGSPVLRFRDGRAAIVERAFAYEDSDPKVRVVALAFGPAPVWGDLASRAEFVVLMNSLAEALAPKPPPATAPVAAELPAPAPVPQVAPPATDLTLWFVLAMAAALLAEGLLASPKPSAPAKM